MIKIVAKKLVKEGKVQEFKEIVGELVEKSLAEEGNVFYSINVSTKNPRMLAFIECWRDQEALDIHNATEHFQRIVPAINELCEESSAEFFTDL
ncbi:MAG: antibiotic biosynthesis monooxygenase [Lachnospiraceae bacterium]|jgi:quinol monooxygenase YgiN|nr:antibiotic biosynthesis monooxygenase [Lachnospiraceae bacterium]MDO4408041.1 putative quinol monooxygenase [Eubacteriales bacterium]